MTTARTWRTLGRYLLFQLPGWVLALVVTWILLDTGWIEPWMAGVLVGLNVVVDLVLYPRVRRAYEPDGPSQPPRLLGARAVALEPLVPGAEGWVRVGPERWRGRLAPGSAAVPGGARLEVREVRALTLVVAPASAPTPTPGAAPGPARESSIPSSPS